MENEIKVLAQMVNKKRKIAGLAVNLEIDIAEGDFYLYRLSMPVFQWQSDWNSAFDILFWQARQYLRSLDD